jgi:EAL domain-containing protein (putative c-di-GMP-specific phosphodiesterase class I)
VYSPEHDRNTAERLALVSDLRRAIECEDLTLHFQPEVDVQTGALIAFEALARWRHATRGMVPPEEFIALAEQTRLIRPLSRWAIRSALRQCRQWDGSLLAVPIAVNLSVHDLQDPGIPDFVAAALSESGVRGERLCIEITESSLMADPGGAVETLTSLRALGVRIAIDDFGTGYSSFEYLRDLPADMLKIDRSFIGDMTASVSSRAIVRAITDLAHDLGLRVIAEGVEDRATWDLVGALGCDVAQGFYMSAALSAGEIPFWAFPPAAGHAGTDLAA